MIVNLKKQKRAVIIYDSFCIYKTCQCVCLYLKVTLIRLYKFYFLMLKINPNTTPKNAAKSTW